MADTKLRDLTAVTSPDDADLVYIVRMTGGPQDRRITVENLLSGVDSQIDGLAAQVAAIETANLSLADLPVYQRAFNVDANDARTSTNPAGVEPEALDTVLWVGYATRPTNMGVNDIWLGPPGASINPQNGTSYTLVLNDGGTVITVNNSSPHVLTIPTNSVPFPIGTIINVYRRGAGSVTLTGATGVTVNGTSAGSVAISARWQGVACLKVGENEWIVSGAIA
jgi:hypothetical protein